MGTAGELDVLLHERLEDGGGRGRHAVEGLLSNVTALPTLWLVKAHRLAPGRR
jgi:hypothetical protein